MITIGVMTGNSLDGADAVMTEFTGSLIRDVAGVSLPYSKTLKDSLKKLHKEILAHHSNMTQIAKTEVFQKTLKLYTRILIEVIEKLIEKSGIDRAKIDAVCISGQSIGEHNPPSVAGKNKPFTTQIFNAAEIAAKIKIPVIYDVRSDDIFNGGEGAPLAPIHNLHLSAALSKEGQFPLCFINGGNTSNLAVISNSDTIKRQVIGFDCGAFNHYVDLICRHFFDDDYDRDGIYGCKGEIITPFLQDLYNQSAVTADGQNFYDLLPPKSAGPHLYNMFPYIKKYPSRPEDILRTVEYFCAYVVFLSLRFIPDDVEFPKCFIVFGGGWNNPIIYHDFENLLHGRGIILPQHGLYTIDILKKMSGRSISFGRSDEFAISSKYMEARIMADMARCYLKNEEFTRPEVTGCHKGAICGVICHPGENLGRNGRGFTFSRAAKGWRTK